MELQLSYINLEFSQRAEENGKVLNLVCSLICWKWCSIGKIVDVDVLAMMFWLIWNNRNAKRYGWVITENHMIQSKAENLINEFRPAHACHRKSFDAVAHVVRWIPPLQFSRLILMGQFSRN